MDLTSDISPPLAFTQAGPREKNEDSIFPAQDQVTERDHLFIVCDGVGGALKGELASQTATTSFAAYLAVQPPGTEIGSDYLNAGLRYVEQQFDALFTEQFLLKGMATTLVMLLLPPGGGATLAHVGDSRAYQVRAGRILFQTADHSLVGDLVRSGQLALADAAAHPQKNVITRAIQGGHKPAALDITSLTDVQPGDYFFLCSDGVWECITDEEIAHCLGQPELSNAEKMAWLQHRCAEGARDNYSGYLIQIL